MPKLQEFITQHEKATITHGDMPQWQAAQGALPSPGDARGLFDRDSVTIETDETVDTQALEKSLKVLRPWRKGPYNICGVEVDSEWRGEMKWNRIKDHLDLEGKTILDIGANNGYYSWRMRGAGASLVVGIDPFPLYVMQFRAIKHFVPHEPVHVLPVGIEDLPGNFHSFDIVFSMGVLYHRRDPLEHLKHIRTLLTTEGELILETFMIGESYGEKLVPRDRYAQMRNVYTVPSIPLLHSWLEQAGYTEVEEIERSVLTTKEQRTTEWMQFHSLVDFLDPEDQTKTIEGYPVLERVVLKVLA